jgi:DNA polymerase I-like protein with 3'-5' exonuclease and polymerase domains
MLQEQVLTNGRQYDGFGLNILVEKYCGVQLEKETRQEFSKHPNKEFSDKQIVYGANDVKYLIPVSRAQEAEAEKLNLTKVFKLENSAALALADISYNGMAVNREGWLKLADKSKDKMLEAERNLDKMVLAHEKLRVKQLEAVQQDLFLPMELVRQVGINWSSPTQVLNTFRLIIPDLENVNSKEIAPLKYIDPIIQAYTEYKEKQKLSQSYGAEFLNHIKSDGRIHTDFQQIQVTGRISSSEPNMQQIPADNMYRNCFEPGIPGWVFVSADYTSQELTLIAHASQDPVWLKALKDGQDLHSVCAELVFGKDWLNSADPDCAYYKDNSKQKCECKRHKKLRQSVKTINFGLAYGMSEHKLSATLQISVEQAKSLIKDYFKVFPKIKSYLDMSGNFGKQKGYIRTLFPWGRIRYFNEWHPDMEDFKALGSIERESKNTPIQGAGADMTKYALIQIRNYINAQNVPVKLVMQVHDQIDSLTPKEYAIEWSLKLKELMEKAALLTVPSGLLKADVNISLVWEK